MRRRDVITLIGGAGVGSYLARAQDRVRRIGVLMIYAESDSEGQARFAAFRDGLRKLGWIEGRNLQIDAHWATQNAETIERSARELVEAKPRPAACG
jgi:putative ABC transport system substrate-binding protein